jgi:hypothetical protein
MTTSTRNFSWAADSQANINNTISQIRQLIATTGMTNYAAALTPDPTPSITDFGYCTYAFPDTLQNTTPVFLKIQFNSYQGNFYLTMFAGSSTDPNGNVTNPYITGSTGVLGGTLNQNLNSYACYVDGTFTLLLGYGARDNRDNNCMMSVVIDRARNNSGAAQASGFLAEMPQQTFGNGYPASRSLYGPSSPSASASFIPSLVPSTTAISTAEGANVNVFRHYSMTPGVRPHLGMLTYVNSEFGALTPFTATVLGSPHTYLPMGYAMNFWSANPNKEHCCAIRWE